MTEQPASELDFLLRDKVRILGALLGQTIERQQGADMLAQIEAIRKQAKKARSGDESEQAELLKRLQQLPDSALVPVARGFNQFLNLANIAEQQHAVSWRALHGKNDASVMLNTLLTRLEQQKKHDLPKMIAQANIELVLTAHPTEIMRRTLIQKYDQIAKLLQERDDLREGHPELANIEEKLASLIDEIWRTDEIRQKYRDQVLSTNGEDFIAFGEALEKVAQSEAVVVLGSQSALEGSKAGLKVTKVV